MSKRGLLGLLVLQGVMLFSECSHNEGGKVQYIKQDQGYVLKVFDGNAKEKSLKIDKYEGQSVVSMKAFALANEKYHAWRGKWLYNICSKLFFGRNNL